MYFNYDSTTYNDAPQKALEDFGSDLLNAFDVSAVRTLKEMCIHEGSKIKA